MKFDTKNGFSDSFPSQKCLTLYIHHCYSLKKKNTTLSILQNFWVDTNLNLDLKSNGESLRGNKAFYWQVCYHLFIRTPARGENLMIVKTEAIVCGFGTDLTISAYLLQRTLKIFYTLDNLTLSTTLILVQSHIKHLLTLPYLKFLALLWSISSC